jgi:membrane associated rhomboid family serine protease
MALTTTSQLGPEFTPKPILKLIGITAFISIFVTLTNTFFIHLFNWSLAEVFSLSWSGMYKWYIWQPLTFIFIQDGGLDGINFWYLINLAFNMYLIWVIGSFIWEQIGNQSFFNLYFGSGITAGVIAFLCMPLLTQYTVISGPSAAILAMLMVWTMMHPETEVSLMFSIIIKAKWLMAGIIGGIVLINLSQLNFTDLIFYMSGVIWGYFYGLIALGLRSPYLKMRGFDQWFSNRLDQISRFARKRLPTNDKVVDIQNGQPLKDDDQFIDEMLAKISRTGEPSLSWPEKQRLKKISEKKRATNEKIKR